jgi:hypothetical protein
MMLTRHAYVSQQVTRYIDVNKISRAAPERIYTPCGVEYVWRINIVDLRSREIMTEPLDFIPERITVTL